MFPDDIEVKEGSAVVGPRPWRSRGAVVFFAGLGDHNAAPFRFSMVETLLRERWCF